MGSAGKSLRSMVEYWFAPDPADKVRVTRIRKGRSTRDRYVRVERLRGTESVGMFFFRHQDGVWRIFPPAQERPAMCGASASNNF